MSVLLNAIRCLYMGFQKGKENVTGNIFFMFCPLKLSTGIINLLHIKTIFCILFAKCFFYLLVSICSDSDLEISFAYSKSTL